MVCIEKKNVTSSNIMSWNLKHFITNVKYLIIYLRLWFFFENFGRVSPIFVGTKLSTTLLLYVITISILIQSSWITSHSSNNLLHFLMKMSHYLTKQQLNHHRTMKIKNTTLRIRNISMWWQTYLTNNLQ
jgi:hypothetical protein